MYGRGEVHVVFSCSFVQSLQSLWAFFFFAGLGLAMLSSSSSNIAENWTVAKPQEREANECYHPRLTAETSCADINCSPKVIYRNSKHSSPIFTLFLNRLVMWSFSLKLMGSYGAWKRRREGVKCSKPFSSKKGWRRPLRGNYWST